MKKPARIYQELADYARGAGYKLVTAGAVHDWRKRGMLPSARNLGRKRRRPGKRIPPALTERVLAMCRYHYDAGIKDLRTVTLLVWLDGADVELDTVRSALEEVRALPARFVRLVGHPAARAEPGAIEADLDISAEAAGRAISAWPLSEAVPRDDLVNAARDALRLATGRGAPERVDDLGPMATALGLDRAHAETLEGAGPWLDSVPAVALAEALAGLHGDHAGDQLSQSTDDVLRQAREVANRLGSMLEALAEISFGFPPGAAGLGLLTHLAGRPELRVLLLYVAVLVPVQAAELANAFSVGDIAGWREVARLGRDWLAAHPEHTADAHERGLVAVLREQA